jgi:hypothetical protein
MTTSGTNRDTNTTQWCTTDGSTPVPATGTAQPYASGATLSFAATTTLMCVGMWGAPNQPTTYPVGPLGAGCSGNCAFGYQPSAQVSATYTKTGGTTTAPGNPSPIILSEIPAQKIVTHADGPNGANYRVAVVIPAQPITLNFPDGCSSGLFMLGVSAGKMQPVCYNAPTP